MIKKIQSLFFALLTINLTAGNPKPEEKNQINLPLSLVLASKKKEKLIKKKCKNNFHNFDLLIENNMINDLSGIERLDLTSCKKLSFYKNKLDSIDPLLQVTSDCLEKLDLRKNNFTYIYPQTLMELSDNFCNLKEIDLSKNKLSNRKELRKYNFKFIVKLRTNEVDIESLFSQALEALD